MTYRENEMFEVWCKGELIAQSVRSLKTVKSLLSETRSQVFVVEFDSEGKEIRQFNLVRNSVSGRISSDK